MVNKIFIATFYAGQIINPEDFHNQPVFGSELALLEVFSRLTNVTVFISKPQGYQYNKFNIDWRSEKDWNQMVTESPPTHIVISRYVGTMIDYLMPVSSKIFLWLHDVIPHPAYNGVQLNENFINNMSRRLNCVITVGDAQRNEIILAKYKIPAPLVKTIKNGITPCFTNESHLTRTRAPMSFVYSSGPDRGLEHLLKFWPQVVKRWPYATLQIFHDLTQDHFNKIRQMGVERVYPMGKVTQKTLFEKLKLIDYWLYPCTFFETCCTTVIEMQYHGVVCLSNGLGALKENSRGIVIGKELDDDFFTKVMETLIDLESHPNKKIGIRKNQFEWAREQTWERRAEEWKSLLC